MVSTGYHDVGEEWAQKWSFRQDTLGTRDTTAEVLMYNDGQTGGDSLTDSSDIGTITTEPTDGNYVRQTLNLDSTDLSLSVTNGNLLVSGSVTFDVTNTTGIVDAWGMVISFQSDVVNAESGQNPHLISTALFDSGSRDLSNFTSLTVSVNLTLN